MPDDNVIGINALRDRPFWWQFCQVNKKGELLSNLNNALVALRNASEVKDCFAFDEMQRAVVMLYEIGTNEPCYRLLRDVDAIALQEWMQQFGMPAMAAPATWAAIEQRADERHVHPPRDYLRALRWDGVPRIRTWLTTYLGAELNAYTMAIGKMFLVSMVARITQPGCQCDYMLVLEGPQGIMKSRACRVLGGEWFSDHLPDIKLKEQSASQHLRGKWLVEVPELHAFNFGAASIEHLKAFITRPYERYFPRFGHKEAIEPRQCVFVGTTNAEQYLRDPSGARRFWPVEVGKIGTIDIDALVRDRDQLFAEAVACFAAEEPWFPTPDFEREFIRPEQEARQNDDLWDVKVERHLEGRSRVTVAEIVKDCLLIPDGQQTDAHKLRVVAILKRLRWSRKRTGKERFYVPLA